LPLLSGNTAEYRVPLSREASTWHQIPFNSATTFPVSTFSSNAKLGEPASRMSSFVN
jgi:hypothetical protein